MRPKKFETIADLLKLVTVSPTGCWELAGRKRTNNYITVSVGGRTGHGHRLAYLLLIGPIPPHYLICHKCNNKQCIRPDPAHCYAGSHKQNVLDMVNTIHGGQQANHWHANTIRIRVAKLLRKGAVHAN